MAGRSFGFYYYMINQNFRYFWLAIAIIGLLSCTKSPFDATTNEGADVINSLDSTIADFKTAFRVIDTLITVDSVASHRDRGSRVMPLEVGSLNGEKSFGYFRFDSLFTFPNLAFDSIDTVVLHLPLASSSVHLASTRVRLFRCAIRDTSDHTPFDTSTIQTNLASMIDTSFVFDSLHTVDTVLLSLAAFRAGFQNINLVTNDTFLRTAILPCSSSPSGQCTTSTAIDTQIIIDTAKVLLPDSGFCIAPVDSGRIVRFGTPSLEIRYAYGMSRGSLSQNAIRTENSVLEANPSSLDRSAVSGYESGRYTVIKLNMAPFWDSVEAVNHGKHFTTVNGCNLVVNYDTTQLNAEEYSPVRVFYHLAPYRAQIDTADTSVLSLNMLTLTEAQIELNHSFVFNLEADANALYAGGKSPPAECVLFIRLASTDATWRWTDWKINPLQKLRIQGAASIAR